jgi:hypothetical protein
MFINSRGDLKLKLSDPIDDESLRDIISLLARYQVELSALKVLVTANNKSWFTIPTKYWYEQVFGAEG